MNDSQKWLSIAVVGSIIWLVYLLAPVLMPFAFAAMLAYLGDPLADRLQVAGLSRTWAVIVVFTMMLLILTLVLLLLVPQLEYQVERFIARLPDYVDWLNRVVLPWLKHRFKVNIKPIANNEIINIIKSDWQRAGGVAASIMTSVSHSGAVILSWFMNALLIPVVAFYLLRDWDILVANIHDLLPRRAAATAAKLAKEVDAVLSAFVRGQVYVMLALGGIYSIGLMMVGLDLALLIGMVSGLVSFVPYLGSIVGIVMACIAALLQFQDVMYLLPVAVVFAVGQALEGMVLTPMLVGDKIGLHPVTVMFAVLAGGQLFGFLGILLALPVASVIMVLVRHAHDLYRGSNFYSLE
ncbi:MAG: AI-2E family transporter [Methylococcaceae bacterium]|jgi:predicted PurR-regulated permease PerM